MSMSLSWPSLEVALPEANAHRQYVVIWYLGSFRPPLLPVRQMTLVEAAGNIAVLRTRTC